MILKTLIIDDEKAGRESLHGLLNDYCDGIEVLGLAPDAEVAHQQIKEYSPDLIFLDIRMPKTDGFELLEAIDDYNFLIVFVTAHVDYAHRAFKTNAMAFIEKPASIQELQSTVEKAKILRAAQQKNPDLLRVYKKSVDNLVEDLKTPDQDKELEKITVTNNELIRIVKLDELIRLEGDDNCTNIYLADGAKIMMTKTLKHFENMRLPAHFVRIHKSHLINLDFVQEYNRKTANLVLMKDEEKLPIARRRLKNFLQCFEDFSIGT